MLEGIRRVPRRIFTFKSTLFLFVCLALWNFKDGKHFQSKFRSIEGERMLICKNNFPIETNLSLCIDYLSKEKRDVIIISASDNTSSVFRSYLASHNNVRGMVFNAKRPFTNNKLRYNKRQLLGTEGKQPLRSQHDVASITAYSLATVFNELNTNIIDIVYLSESKYLENILLTAISTDAIKHIKYLVLRGKKNKMQYFSNFLKDSGMIELECINNNPIERTCAYLQQQNNFDAPVIQMDYFTKWRHNPNSDVKFVNNEAEQLMFEVYLHKYLSYELLMERFYKWLFTPTVMCPHYKRFGKPFDGGWDVCLSYNLIREQNCKVYSFGINNDFSFDDAISKEKGCKVRSFDPSMADIGEKRSDLVSFYRIGLSGKNTVNAKNWKLNDWKTILEMFDDFNGEIDYLKFDIESSEWSMLLTALSDRSLKKVRQMAFEIHGVGSPYAPIIDRWRLLKRLEAQGFAKWEVHLNSWTMGPIEYSTQRVHCVEIYYINLNYVES